jgi:hypothetical protein
MMETLTNMEEDLPTKRSEAYPYQVYHLLYVSITFTAAGQTKKMHKKIKEQEIKDREPRVST